MRIYLLALILLGAYAHAQQPHVYVSGADDKWYSAPKLEQIAKDYLKARKMEFAFDDAKPIVWVNNSGSNALASVSFASGVGSGIVVVDIDRHGKVITNAVGAARSHIGNPGHVEKGHPRRTNRVHRAAQ